MKQKTYNIKVQITVDNKWVEDGFTKETAIKQIEGILKQNILTHAILGVEFSILVS